MRHHVRQHLINGKTGVRLSRFRTTRQPQNDECSCRACMYLISFKSHKSVMRQPFLLYPSFYRDRERLRTTNDVPTAHNPCDPQTQAVSGLADSTCSPRMSHDLLLLLRFSQKVRNRRPDLLLQSFTPGYTFQFPVPSDGWGLFISEYWTQAAVANLPLLILQDSHYILPL